MSDLIRMLSEQFSHRSPLRGSRLWGAVISFYIAVFGVSPAYSDFSVPDGALYETDDGTVALAWGDESVESDSNRIYEVRRWERGGKSEGVLVYEGMDTASFLSGLPEGEYELRVRAREPEGLFPEWGEESLTVKVEYIDRRWVVGLMTAGFITFVAIVASIVLGHRVAKREETAIR